MEATKFHKFRQFATLEAGYAACDAEGTAFPFVVRAANSFQSIAEINAALRSQLRKEQLVTGYAGGKTFQLPGRVALQQWEDNTLGFNIVDSSSTRGSIGLLPKALGDINRTRHVPESVWLAYVLSPSRPHACGELHIDPPFGSGWQYLATGSKVWYVLDGSSFSLAGHTASLDADQRLQPPCMSELAKSNTVFQVTIGAGDFVSCPMDWPHAVLTLEASLGLSGYTATPNLTVSPCLCPRPLLAARDHGFVVAVGGVCACWNRNQTSIHFRIKKGGSLESF